MLLLLVAISGICCSACHRGSGNAREAVSHPNDPYLTIDFARHEVRVKADISLAMRTTRVLLEFLLVSGQYDKEEGWKYKYGHESLFVTRASPDSLQKALKLIGLKSGLVLNPDLEELSEYYLGFATDKRIGDKEAVSQAQMIDVVVEWEIDGKVKTERAEAFLYDRESKKTSVTTPFAFTGSYPVTNHVGDELLAADLTKVIIPVFYDESAILNLPFRNPICSLGDDMGFELNADSLPADFQKPETTIEGHEKRLIKLPVIRPVTLVFRASKLKPPTKKKLWEKVKSKEGAEKEK